MTHLLAGWQRNDPVSARRTLEQMRRNIRGDLKKPIVWETAREIVARVPERDYALQAKTIRSWCKSHFRYVADPVHVDLLTTPQYDLEKIKKYGYFQGDCDDAATITAALCEAVGISCTLWAVAFISPTAPFSHVFTVANLRGGGVQEMDVSHPDDTQRRIFTRRLPVRV